MTIRWHAATAGLISAVAIIAAVTLPSYGLTIDEEHSLDQGRLMLRWYSSGFTDRRVIEESDHKYYGGFANAPAIAAAEIFGSDPYRAARAVTLVFGIAGLILAAWTGTRLGGPRTGFLATLLLALTPVYYGHSIVNIKDVPFAVMCLASFAAIASAWPSLPFLRRRHILVLGVTIGLTAGVRVVGLMWFAYLGLTAVESLRLTRLADLRERRAEIRALLIGGAQVFVVTWIVMMLCWPWAQVNPILSPLKGLYRFLFVKHWVGLTLFNGQDVLSTELPRSYLLVWFGSILPETFAVAAVLGLAALLVRSGDRRPIEGSRFKAIALLALTVVLPFTVWTIKPPVLYDGIRHVLFLVPPMAILAGLMASRFFDVVTNRAARATAALMLLVAATATVADMIRLHPYQSVYFNRLIAGGLPGAYGRFETDYWGESFREGTEWVIANAGTLGTAPTRLAVCAGHRFQVSHHIDQRPELAGRFVMVNSDQPHDIMLATTRWGCAGRPGREIHRVTRMGVPLLFIKDVR